MLAGYGVVDCEFRLLEYDWRRRTEEADLPMSATRRKSGKQVQKNGPVQATSVSDASDAGTVLTLSEAAAYLRIAESQVQAPGGNAGRSRPSNRQANGVFSR